MKVVLFGSPQFTKNGKQLQIERRKSIALLAYLLLSAGPQSRDTLATLFWSENDQSGARANLRRELSRLRQEVGDEFLIVDRDQVMVNPGADLCVDVVEFQDRIKGLQKHNHSLTRNDALPLCSQCQEALNGAVELYKGAFMAGFSLPDSPEFDEWQFFQAESLRQSLSRALQHLIHWHTERKEYGQSIDYARRWLALDNLHEEAHRQLMLLYALSGQHSAAIRQYQECQRLLREEIGVEPETETQELYEAIRTRKLSKDSPGSKADQRSSLAGASAARLPSQSIGYCTSPDGVRIAYATVGEGPVLVKAANWLSHLEYDWDSPVWRHWLNGLSKNHTLIRYDERGCGLSDWDARELSVDAFVRDLETVVDTLGLERFPLLGVSQGGPVAITYAVRHPEKVSHLILYGTYARGRLNRGYSQAEIDLGNTLLSMIKLGWGTDNPAFRQVFTSLFMPEASAEQRDWFNELQRKTTSPENALRLESAFFHIDVSHLASQVAVPTLVLHAPQDGIVPYLEGEWLANNIPTASRVDLNSKNHILLESDPAWHQFLDEVNRFIGRESPVLASVSSQDALLPAGIQAESAELEVNAGPLAGKSQVSLLEGIEVFSSAPVHSQVQQETGIATSIRMPGPTFELPQLAMPFLGRGIEQAEVRYMLTQEPGCRLVTLIGPGGIGKTSLAIQTAATLVEHFPDGVVFVPLEAYTSAEDIAPAIADALYFNLSGGGEGILQLLDFLHAKQLCLVVDNFEHLLDGIHLLERILLHCPGIKFLVTTRQALNIQEEWLYPLQGLPYPQLADENDPPAFTSVQLFVERARRVRRDFSPDEDWQGVARICRLVEGIPLAIELAASWTRTLSLGQIANEIQRNMDFLATRMRDIPERHRSMQAVFDQSWSLLSREEQSVFKRLSIFRGGFLLEAARQVANASLSVLSALVDKSLLRVDVEGRYEIHELLRQYAEDQLAQSREEIERIRDLHCAYYADYVYARLPGLLGGEQQDNLVEVKADMDNIRIAWLWAVEMGKIEEMQKSLHSLVTYYQYQSRFLEGVRAFEKAIPKIRDLEPSEKREYLLAQALVCQGWFHVRLGQLDEATHAFEESQELYARFSEAFSPPAGVATDPLVGLSMLSNMRGEYDQAVRIAELAEAQNSVRQDKHNLAFVHYVLTSAYMAQGDYPAALQSAERAYKLASEVRDSWFMAYILNEWGNVARAMGRYAEARQRYLDSYDIRETFNDPEGMAVALNHLGRIAVLEKDYLEGKGFYQQSLSLYQNINDRGGLSASLAGLGNVAAGLGEMEKAGEFLHQALQTVWDIRHVPLTLAILIDITGLYLKSGLIERAIELLMFVSNDPTSDHETRDRAKMILEQNKNNLPGFQLAAAQKRVEAFQLESLIMELLHELGVSEKEIQT